MALQCEQAVGLNGNQDEHSRALRRRRRGVLQVSKSGSKSWVFRFTLAHVRREMRLGSLQTVSLAFARAKERMPAAFARRYRSSRLGQLRQDRQRAESGAPDELRPVRCGVHQCPPEQLAGRMQSMPVSGGAHSQDFHRNF